MTGRRHEISASCLVAPLSLGREEFFETFETNKLAFLYQDRLESGETSRFSKLIDHDSAEAKAV